MYVCILFQRCEAMRRGSVRSDAVRSGEYEAERCVTMTMKVSVASTNAIQKCLPFNKRVIIFDHFRA